VGNLVGVGVTEEKEAFLNHFGIVPHVFGVQSKTFEEFVVAVGNPTEVVVNLWFRELGDDVEDVVAGDSVKILFNKIPDFFPPVFGTGFPAFGGEEGARTDRALGGSCHHG
jgi:hypothetical protein